MVKEKTKEELQKEIEEFNKKQFTSAEEKAKKFIQELAGDGFGLDANFIVGRNGIEPNIFVVRLDQGK